MNFKTIISYSIILIFCSISDLSFAQTQQNDLSVKEEVTTPIKNLRNGNMKLAPNSNTKNTTKKEKQKRNQLTPKRKGAKKNDRLYSSKASIERAKMELQRKKSLGKMTSKEIQAEEKKINKSEIDLSKKTKNTSSFSKKLKKTN